MNKLFVINFKNILLYLIILLLLNKYCNGLQFNIWNREILSKNMANFFFKASNINLNKFINSLNKYTKEALLEYNNEYDDVYIPGSYLNTVSNKQLC